MKLSAREISLGWATTAVVLLGVTYWLGAPKLAEWKALLARQADLEREVVLAERLLGQKQNFVDRLAVVREKLPQYTEDKKVMAELLRKLDQPARDSGLELLRRVPMEEEAVHGNLYEVSIRCDWQGELDPLVRFLYEIQLQGANMDISKLNVSPSDSEPDKLKGSFTIDCAYTREGTNNVVPTGP